MIQLGDKEGKARGWSPRASSGTQQQRSKVLQPGRMSQRSHDSSNRDQFSTQSCGKQAFGFAKGQRKMALMSLRFLFPPISYFFVHLFLKKQSRSHNPDHKMAKDPEMRVWLPTWKCSLSCLWWSLNGWKYIKLLLLTCKSYLYEVYPFLSSALSSGTFWLLNTGSNKIMMCSACVFLRQTLTFSSRSRSSYRNCCGIDVVCSESLIVRDWSSQRSVGEVLP